MRTDVLQTIALSAYGAEFIREEDRPLELLTTHGTFRSVHAMEFRRSGTMHGGMVAESVAPWYRRLAAEGVVMIRPVLAPCLLSGEGSDSPWGVLTDGDRGMEIWRPQWRARMAGHDDAKPHRVTYTAERLTRWNLPPVASADAATLSLTNALVEKIDRLKRAGQADAAFPLDRCLDFHLEKSEEFSGYEDLWPSHTDLAGRRLAASSLRLAVVVSSVYPMASSSAEKEIYANLWTTAMQGFEAAVTTVLVAKAA